jgi:hypothetical protein
LFPLTVIFQGGQDYYNRRIPFIVASNSPRVDVGRAPHDDPGSHMDFMPTIMHFFGGPEAVPSGLDGQVFGFRDFNRTVPLNSFCADSEPSTCGCSEVKQADYRGTLAKTVSGRICQPWSSQMPQEHSNSPEARPLSGLEENYCRNPDGEDGAWCYTTDPAKRWELCAVPTCSSGACDNSDPAKCGCTSVKQEDF